MRVLLDEQLPRQLAREITNHETRTVQQAGFSGLKNGDLLKRAKEVGFDVFVTADRNLQFQQNLSRVELAIIVLRSLSNTLEDLLPLVPELLEAIPRASVGAITLVSASANDPA